MVGKHPCLIHPEDRIDEHQCVQWAARIPGTKSTHFSLPPERSNIFCPKKVYSIFISFYAERSENIALVSSFDEKQEANPVRNHGVQSIAFKVQLK